MPRNLPVLSVCLGSSAARLSRKPRSALRSYGSASMSKLTPPAPVTGMSADRLIGALKRWRNDTASSISLHRARQVTCHDFQRLATSGFRRYAKVRNATSAPVDNTCIINTLTQFRRSHL